MTILNTPLTKEIFFDSNGNYYKAIYINSYNLEQNGLLDKEEISLLKNMVDNFGVKLLISDVEVDDRHGMHTNLKRLINNENINILNIENACYYWNFSDELPLLTKEFTNQKLQSSKQIKNNFTINTYQSFNNIKVILSLVDEQNLSYPIFTEFKNGSGEIFIQSGNIDSSLEEEQMYTLYNIEDLSVLIPMMMFIKYALNDECWHNDHNYANLAIDDPFLSESSKKTLSYYDLLSKMEIYGFHTTIGFIAKNWVFSQKEIIKLFLQNPDLFSIVIHGNNHDGYEFYKYSIQKGDEYEARSIDDQEYDIIQALFRMELHKIIKGIPFDKIMIFPYGISPEDTLVLLKKYNFKATVNSQDTPLDSTRGTNYDYMMYQAVMNYANFPVITRNSLSKDRLPFSLFDTFIDKPILYYTHANENFSDSIDLVKQINGYKFPIEWKSLGFIIKHLYLEKLNDDNSMDVKMYTNNLIVSNESDIDRIYHIKKEEKLNVPIINLTVNGKKYYYQIKDGILYLDIEINAKSSIEIKIIYGSDSVIEKIKDDIFIIKCITPVMVEVVKRIKNKFYREAKNFLSL